MIDTEALRKKVIDLAIQGKLTEQLLEDGDAETLYAQIQEEKAKQIRSGKLKKEKPVPSVSEEEIPYEIPDNWKWVRMIDVVDVRDGTHDSPHYYKKGVPLVTSKNLSSGELDLSNVKYISEQDAQKINERSAVDNGDILFAMIGSIGNPVIVEKKEKFCIKNVALFKLFSDLICTKYLYFYLIIEQYVFRTASIGGLQPFISLKQFRCHVLPLPPLAEQKRIVEKVDRILAQIQIIDDLQKQYETNVEVMKKKIINAGIRGQLTEQLPEDGDAETLYAQIQKEKEELIKDGKLKKEKALPPISDDEIPFDMHNNWKWCRLGDLVSVFGGKRIPAGRSLTTTDTGHKYIRVSEMKKGTVLTDNLLFVPEDIFPSISRYVICKEDVYITVAGTIGKVGKIPEIIDGANLTENADRLVFSFLNQDWLICFLSSSFVQKQIERLTTQVAQPKLAISRIQEFVIALPPLEEQKRIVERIDELLKCVED